jgi:valyl-tRNA synthetase
LASIYDPGGELGSDTNAWRTGGEIAALPLKGVIDLAAEKARLEKELAKVASDARIDGKLGNADFIARAPEEVDREKREEALARRAKILEALERLKSVREPSSRGAGFKSLSRHRSN